jgi:hypothetical protein
MMNKFSLVIVLENKQIESYQKKPGKFFSSLWLQEADEMRTLFNLNSFTYSRNGTQTVIDIETTNNVWTWEDE